MAAPKVDELLVSFWLGSDEVYEDVLNLIEKYRLQRQGQQQSHTATATATAVVVPPVVVDNHSKNESTTTSGSSIPIPPFYPLRTATGTKLQRRRQMPRPAETWDRLWNLELDGDNVNVNVNENAAAAAAAAKSYGISHEDDDPMMDTETNSTTLKTTTTATAAAAVCVKDQVEGLVRELQLPEESFTTTFSLESFVRITKEICNFPSFFNGPLYQRIVDSYNELVVLGNATTVDNDNTATTATAITLPMLEWFWKTEMEPYDPPERFFRLVKQRNNDCILRDDFLPFIKALLNDHPGLEFLSNHAEFQEKYAVTVITRIFYTVNKCHSGRITSRQIRRSDLLDAFGAVDEEEDINKVTRYFSYEHFYVLYCRFWELDHDRDYRITREDLLKYGDHSLSHMIVDRIFDAAPRPFCQNKGVVVDREFLSYEDFIYFMLSEEDKANDVSVQYWFSCVDVDGDGKLNNMEMRSFYAVQLHRMQCMGHEIVPFEDMLCQMMDMIKPKHSDCLIVSDFLQPECKQVSGAVFDALFNLNKYLLFEQRDPFVERQKREDEFETDWDRFACIDYNRLAMEEEAREEEAMEIDWVTVDDDETTTGSNSSTAAAEDFTGGPAGGSASAPY